MASELPCFVCDRGEDPTEFCDVCTDHLNDGRMEEALYDLNLAILKELRILNGATTHSPTLSGQKKLFLVRVEDCGKQKIRLIKELRAKFGSPLRKAKDVAEGHDHMEFFGTQNEAMILRAELMNESDGCVVKLST